jgi:hypothetical protein
MAAPVLGLRHPLAESGIAEPAPYERLVASQFRPIWNGWRRAYFFTGAAGLSMGLGGAAAGAAG